jgi:thymidylate kinase
MIVHVEGLSGVGKTTLLTSLSSPNIEIIPEFVFETDSINSQICMQNDELKCRLAKFSMKELIFLDRGYMSTLVYESTKEYVQNGVYDAKFVWEWYNSMLNKSLFMPDLYVYLNLPTDIILERFKKRGRNIIKDDYWISHPNIAKDFYFKFFKEIEPNIPVIVIENNEDMSELQFLEMINNKVNYYGKS